MGNLPTSRTTTINTGDPIAPGLINEIQDCIVASSKSPKTESFFPAMWFNSGASPALLVPNPTTTNETLAWKLTGAGGRYQTAIPFVGGDTIQGLEIDLFGDGVVDLSNTFVQYFPTVDDGAGGGIGSIGSLSVTNVPAAWVNYAFTTTPTLLANRGYLLLRIAPNPGGSFVHAGRVRPIFSR